MSAYKYSSSNRHKTSVSESAISRHRQQTPTRWCNVELEDVVLVGHVNCPGKLVTLRLVVDLFYWHGPLLTPTRSGEMNE